MVKYVPTLQFCKGGGKRPLLFSKSFPILHSVIYKTYIPTGGEMQLNKRYKWFSFTIVFIITAVFFFFPQETTFTEMPEVCAGCEKECLVKVCIDWDAPGENGCVPGPNDLGCCRPENYELQCDPDCIPPDRPPSINGTLNCSSWGNSSWCIGNESRVWFIFSGELHLVVGKSPKHLFFIRKLSKLATKAL